MESHKSLIISILMLCCYTNFALAVVNVTKSKTEINLRALTCPPNVTAALNPNSNWQTRNGTIASNGEQVFQFTAVAGTSYVFKTGCGNGATATFDTFLELYNNSCLMLTSNDDGCDQNKSTITWTCNTPGVHYIKVRGYYATQSGTFTLAYQANNGTSGGSNNGNCGSYNITISPTTTWLTHDGTILANGSYVYRIAVVNGISYTFKTCDNGGTANFDTYLELAGNDCNIVAYNDDACEFNRSSLTWTANYSGYAYLKVRGYSANSSGNYTLAYMAGNQGDTGGNESGNCTSYNTTITPTTSWQTDSKATTVGNSEYIYRVGVTAGVDYTFQTGCGNGATANFDTFLELFNQNCTRIAYNDDGCASYTSALTWTATSSGYVYLKVRGFSATHYGNFTLAYHASSGSSSGGNNNCTNFDYELTPNSNWQATPTRSVTANQAHIYKITVTTGNVYHFQTGCGNNATANFDTYLELLDNNCTILAYNDDNCESYRSAINWTSTTSGFVYLKVRGYNATNYGNYTLAYQTTSGSSSNPGTSCVSYDYDINPSTNWQATATRTVSAGGAQVYRVNVTAGLTYIFKTGCGDGASATFDTFLELLNNSCTQLASNDDGCESNRSLLSWTSNVTGYVYLKVRGYNSSSYGNYTMAYQTTGNTAGVSPNACANFNYSITPTTTWSTHAATIAQGEAKVYRVTVSNGVTYNFKTGCGNGATANFDTYLELMNDACTVVAYNDDGCENTTSSLSWTSTVSGYVYLKVRAYRDNLAGDYTLAYQATTNGNVNPSNPITCTDYNYNITPANSWQTTTHNIAAGNFNIYRVYVTNGYNYTFKTGCGNGATANFDSYLELNDGNCNVLIYNDDACESNRSSLNWIATTTGYVYLKVRGYNNSNYGNYTLAYNGSAGSASNNNNDCANYNNTITPSTARQANSQTISAGNNYVYRVAVTNGVNYSFRTGCGNEATANFDTYLELFDGNCTLISSNDDGCDANRSVIDWVSTLSGYVYLKVRGYNNSHYGSYTLVYQAIGNGSGITSECLNYNATLSPTISWQNDSRTISASGTYVYQIPVYSGYTYNFKTGCANGATANFDTYLEIFDNSCATLAYNDDGCESMRSNLAWNANYTGYAYLKVRGYNSTNYGSFTLAYNRITTNSTNSYENVSEKITTKTDKLIDKTASAAYLWGDILTVYSPYNEMVTLYSVGGTLLYQGHKNDGQITLNVGDLPRGVIIVRGETGWAKKIVK